MADGLTVLTSLSPAALAHFAPVEDIHTRKRGEHCEDGGFGPSCILVIDCGSEEVATDATPEEKEEHAKTAKLRLEHEAREKLRQQVDHNLSETLIEVQ